MGFWGVDPSSIKVIRNIRNASRSCNNLTLHEARR